MVNLFLSLDFMKVSVEKQHSFAIEPIIYNKFSQLDVLHDFYFKNPRRSKGSPQLGYWVDIKRFLHCQLNILCHGENK
jgi:hypothetical protein